MKLVLDKSYHKFEPGDLFRQSSGFIGMFVYSPDENHMTPHMIIDMKGNVICRSTSIGLCINQLTSEKPLEFIGRIKLESLWRITLTFLPQLR